MNKIFSFLHKSHQASSNGAKQFHAKLMHPGRDWVIGIGIFITVFIAGSVASALLFVKYNSVDISGGESTVVLPRYNEPLAEEVINLYSKRKAAFEALIVPKASSVQTATENTSTTTVPENATTTPEVPSSSDIDTEIIDVTDVELVN